MELHGAAKKNSGSHARGIKQDEEREKERKAKEERGRHRGMQHGGGK